MTTIPVAVVHRRDLGRLTFLPICVVLVVANATRLVSGETFARAATLATVGTTASAALTIAFYWLVIRAYLHRLPARASSRAKAVNVAALVATALPLLVPLLRAETTATTLLVTGDGLLLAGLGWSVWSIRALGRSFSVIPQARAVVSTGPYRLVRHPLYLGEIVATLGLATLRPSPATFLAWASLSVLQIYRASREEEVLAAALPDYDSYRTRTRRLLPGLY